MEKAQERIGQTIGDYRLLRLLGEGAFGTVYLAQNLHDHTSAAVKLFHNPLKGREALRAFLNEARMIRLRHPHIIPILDFGLSRHDDLPYLVMAYADGGSLRDRHPKGSKLSFKTIDTYVQQLADALQYAHDHRIIHRDVKPQNMLISGGGAHPDKVQLSDFGIAKISELASLSSQHRGAGTPAYAAPEQSRGKPCPASDQYALAIVVYEWLAGQRPFQGDPLALMLQHHKDMPSSLCSICPQVTPEVEQVIFKALAKSPEDRFPTITHFAQALHTALQEETTQLLPRLDEPQTIPSPIAPAPLPDELSLPGLPSIVPPVLAQTSPFPQPQLASLPSVDTPSVVLAEILQTPLPVPDLQKRPSRDRLRRTLIVLFCFVFLLGGGGATLLIARQPEQPDAVHSSNTFVSPSATAIANMYWAGVASNGVQFGFDAAHTRTNPYERLLNAANASHLTQLWSFKTKKAVGSSPVVANGMVYVGSDDKNFYAFDANCRKACMPRWSFTTGGAIQSSPAVGVKGMVYVGSDDKNFYAFDAGCRGACKPLWSFTTKGRVRSSPVVTKDMVYVGSEDNTLYAFDAGCREACKPRWSFATGGAIYSSPAVGANGMVYIGSYDENFYAFDAGCPEPCKPLWSFTTGKYITSSPAVGANGMVYIGSYDENFYAFDASCRRDCKPRWSFPAGDAIGSSAAVTKDMVYIGSDGHKFYAFDAKCSGGCQPRWSFPTQGLMNASPIVANGVVYVGSSDSTLYAFDASCHSDCQPLRSFPAGSPIQSPPTVANGVVYVGCDDGTFYALGLS
jgi:serine/threonine-protein kinase